ncbi:unnamed protein product [Bursaphelenchus okinawaensis]|uniref:EB domain-containing protein n=1 Tax=Bursaphelenchus okinawaensis TaxID=465554 RepID=A0A811LI96_9BILA|nr:unnamed protein product [Bursaphelenchus okinawaensis]CAG9126304.1 unnamed protein product [Bursaphelenchus okinawaensis]
MLRSAKPGRRLCLSFFLLVLVSPTAGGSSFMPSTVVSNFFESVKKASQLGAEPGQQCLLDAQCSLSGDVICSQKGRCECATGSWNGAHCVAYDDDNQDDQYAASGEELALPEKPECSSLEVEKNGKCYVRKKPGETCDFSEQCMNIGDVQYYCIANICQEAPECPPGYVAMGAECLPYSVTGGPCIHPIQCLTGSVCIKGKCRGPCDFNQVFLEEACVDYEGAGCVAISCISNKCPRSFPSCNYIAQQKDYLCCDRSMETKVTCPLPNSEPQRDKETGNVVECMHRPCTANYRCVFASYGRGKYICCSKPKPKKKTEENEMTEEEELDFYGEKTTTKGPWVPPPPRPVDTPWTPDPRPVQNNMNWPYNNNNYNNWANWNNNYNNWGTNWANRNWGTQNWNNGWGRNNNWNNYNYGQQWNNGQAMRRRKIRPNTELGKIRPASSSNWIVGSKNFPRRLTRKRPKRPIATNPFIQHHPGIHDVSNITNELASVEVNQPDHKNSWTHAIKVLIYWCCTNKPCIYRDHLGAFCSQILDSDAITQHLAATDVDDYDELEQKQDLETVNSFPITVV